MLLKNLTLAKNIRIRREQLNLSQSDISKALGYKSYSTIAKIEAGENDVAYEKILAFAKVLNTTPEALMGLSTELNSSKLCDLINICKDLSDTDIDLIISIAHRLRKESGDID